MSYPMPPLLWLRSFEAAARHCSFVGAAKELGLTPSAVSHHVRSLEHRLRARLFERLPRSVVLTDVGSAYLPAIRMAFEDIAAVTAGMFGPIGQQSVIVRVTISFAMLRLNPCLPEITRDLPGISFQIVSGQWTDTNTPDDADILIQYGHGDWPGFHALALPNEAAIPVCSPTVAAPVQTREAFFDIARRGFVHVLGYEYAWPQLLQQLGYEGSTDLPGVRVDTSLAALDLATRAMGSALILKSFAQPYLDDGRLVMPYAVEYPVEATHWLLLPQRRERIRPEVSKMHDWLCERFRGAGGR